MKKLSTLLLFLVFCALSAFGQSLKPDTIDYSNFIKKEYVLYKLSNDFVIQTKFDYYNAFFMDNDTNGIRFVKKTKLKVNPRDTMTDASWDIDNKKQFASGPIIAKAKLNKATNILTLEKVDIVVNPTGIQKEPVIARFKILKWTKTQVILIDLTHIKAFERIYYFKPSNRVF